MYTVILQDILIGTFASFSVFFFLIWALLVCSPYITFTEFLLFFPFCVPLLCLWHLPVIPIQVSHSVVPFLGGMHQSAWLDTKQGKYLMEPHHITSICYNHTTHVKDAKWFVKRFIILLTNGLTNLSSHLL